MNGMRKIIFGGRVELKDAGARQVAAALRNGDCEVIKLDVAYNSITDHGAIAIADALWSNTTLTRLNLMCNKITNRGARALAKALMHNKTLTHLSLGGNCISDEGAKAIAEALRSNTTLVSLNLAANNICDAGAEAVAESLMSNISLNQVRLIGNSISEDLHAAVESLGEDIEYRTVHCLGRFLLAYPKNPDHFEPTMN